MKEFAKERGFGTFAMRVFIIEVLIMAEYIQRKMKQLVFTEYGRVFATSLPESVKSTELIVYDLFSECGKV